MISDNDIWNKWYWKLIGLYVIVVIIIVIVVWVIIIVVICVVLNCIWIKRKKYKEYIKKDILIDSVYNVYILLSMKFDLIY